MSTSMRLLFLLCFPFLNPVFSFTSGRNKALIVSKSTTASPPLHRRHRPSTSTITTSTIHHPSVIQTSHLHSSTETLSFTDLPDSMEDAAIQASQAVFALLSNSGGGYQRCRVDFDTSAGDATYTYLKASTPFMQKFVTSLCYQFIPPLQQIRQEEMMRVAKARAELMSLAQEQQQKQEDESIFTTRKQTLLDTIQKSGRLPETAAWLADASSSSSQSRPIVVLYFPDEGSAALARRDWKPYSLNAEEALVPPCVLFRSVQQQSLLPKEAKNIILQLYFCPRASEAQSVEQSLYQTEEEYASTLQGTIFVNPIFVDMGTTGFGLAGRMLRERLVETLIPVYYLRTLSWGAMTRIWPKLFSIWKEDANASDGTGYTLIHTASKLPSNPEVEEIYDLYNNGGDLAGNNKGGFLNAIGDFMQGLTRL